MLSKHNQKDKVISRSYKYIEPGCKKRFSFLCDIRRCNGGGVDVEMLAAPMMAST